MRPSRPFNFLAAFGIPLVLMALLLVSDTKSIDFAAAGIFYAPGLGFVGRNNFWLEDILHDRAKQAVILLFVAMLSGFVISLWRTPLRPWRRHLGYLVLAIGLSTSVVPPLKVLTNIQCPWSLAEFGGTETFQPLLGKRVETSKPGHCWPGGHATTGFSLLAFFFALRDLRPPLARMALVAALALGGIFSLGRMLQGAHFLSHNLWTLLIDWLICLTCYRVVLYHPSPTGPPESIGIVSQEIQGADDARNDAFPGCI